MDLEKGLCGTMGRNDGNEKEMWDETACNSSPRGSDSPFWPIQTLQAHGTRMMGKQTP